jgi:hypothetical protein
VAGATVTVPVAVFLLVLYVLHIRPHHVPLAHNLLSPAAVALVLAVTFTGIPVLATGLILAALVAASVVISRPAA